MLEAQIGYVARARAAMRRRGLDWVDVREDVQAGFDRWVEALSSRTVWETGCHNKKGASADRLPSYGMIAWIRRVLTVRRCSWQ